MYIDEYNYIPIGLLVILALCICVTFITFLKNIKKHKFVKYIRIISVCVLILGIGGLSVNIIKGYYFNNLESDILLKQSINSTVLYPTQHVYYEVNSEYGVIKSINENEYSERSREKSEYKETVSKASKQILKSAGYDVVTEYGKPCLVTLNNNIYFAVDNGNNGQSYLKYDSSTASIDKDFSPKSLSKGNTGVLSKLNEIATVDAYPELENCVQRYEINQTEYGEIIISNGRVVVCMFDNSEQYKTNWLLYEYDQSLKDFKLLCTTRPYSTEEIIFLQ